MKTETMAFQTMPIDHQNRFTDRISFLYLEYARIIQEDSGVIALTTNYSGEGIKLEIQIPVASVALLILGPGTSITHAALTSCARSGCVVQISGGGGFPAYSTITSLTNSSKWAIAQAIVASSQTESKKVAKAFYRKQFGLDNFEGSITQMRGLEGSLVRKIYAAEARKRRISKWYRDTKGEDNVNIALNIGNGILYGLAASMVGSLSMNPALGVIHRGNWKSLLFDVADLYKPSIMIPLAFSLSKEKVEDVPSLVRKKLRKEIYSKSLMSDMFEFALEVFQPYTPENNEDRLIGQSSEVPGGINYGSVDIEEIVF